MHEDRRADGPTLLRADVQPRRPHWGRRPLALRVTSRQLHWGPPEDETSVPWDDVTDVEQQGGSLLLSYLDAHGAPQQLQVLVSGPVGYLVAEEVARRSEAARRNALRLAG